MIVDIVNINTQVTMLKIFKEHMIQELKIDYGDKKDPDLINEEEKTYSNKKSLCHTYHSTCIWPKTPPTKS